MGSRRSRPEILLLALAVGCTSDGDGQCRTEEAPRVAVMRTITFGRNKEGVSDGFDLDGAVTEAGGTTGCGIVDYTAPDGTPGIDNAFANMLPALEMTEAQAVEGLIQQAINDGRLLMLLKIDGMDDEQDDDCVDVGVMRGSGEALVGGDGFLLEGQTLDVDPAVPPAWVRQATVADGQVVASPLTLDIPLQIFDNQLEFQLKNASFRAELLDDGTYAGAFAGGVDVAAFLEVVNIENVSAELVPLVTTLVNSNADLEPDANGVCTQVSMTFEYTAVPAYLFEDGS